MKKYCSTNKFSYYIIITIFIFSTFITNAQIYEYDSENSKLIYIGKGSSYLVPHTVRTFENAYSFLSNFWNYQHREDVTILFNDFSDIGNGGTMIMPRNFLSIAISPFEYTFDVMPSNERMQWLMNHELTHVVIADKPSSSDMFFRNLFFGKVVVNSDNPLSMIYSYLTTPRWYCPRWYHEGIAVFMETWMSGGMGRVLGGYDEMVFRTMVNENSYFYRPVGLETEGTTIDFQVGVNAYLYGTRFVSYLANKYGIEKLKTFYNRTDESSRFFATQFKNTYNISLEDEWENWIKWEEEFQKINLKSINKYPVTQYSELSEFPLGSVSKPFFDKKNRLIYAAVFYPGDLSKLISLNIDTKEMKKVADIPSAALYYVTSLAFNEKENKIFFSTQNSDWRGLKMLDLNADEEDLLIEYTRAGDFAFNTKTNSLWAIQHNNGRATLIEIPAPYKEINPIYTIPYGKSLFDLDISADGEFLSGTMSEVSGKQYIVMIKLSELMNGNYDFQTIYEFEDNSASNFVFSDDGKYLFGTSYYTGVSNVYRIEIQTKKMEILTNAETGFFRPLQISPDSLIVFKFMQNGLQPVKIKIQPIEDVNSIDYLGQQIVKSQPQVKDWMLPPPSDINVDSMLIYEGDYLSFSKMNFASIYPIVEGYKDFPAYGLKFNLMDPIGVNSLVLTGTYSPNLLLPENERLHLMLNYKYWEWELKATSNYADFYDLFGPTKLSRKGYSVSLKYKDYLMINKKPETFDYYLKLSAYGDLEKMPDYQNINATFDKMYSGIFNIHYSYLRKSLGAVEYEQGLDWEFFSLNSYVNDRFIPRLMTNCDLGFLLPIRNSSIWLRSSIGYSFGDRDNPFANFYFGGFGNNWVDHSSVQRYRDINSFPGIEINEAGGSNFAKILLEWNLPPMRFKKLGFLTFYTTYSRFSFFSSALLTNLDKEELREPIYDFGGQLDFELVLFSLLKSNLSFGYARAFGDGLKPKDEFMISLKL